jgi:hypothetical protein
VGLGPWSDDVPRELVWTVPADVDDLRFGCTVHPDTMTAQLVSDLDGERTKPRSRVDLSHADLALEDLPLALGVRLLMRDADGHPFDGGIVTFSVSPPGLPTQIGQAALVDGVASWDDVVIGSCPLPCVTAEWP